MNMIELVTPGAVDQESLERLGPFLLEHGVDLVAVAAPSALERGTPVYVDADADPLEVQRRMALAHVRMLFVLDDGVVVGAVDAADLCERAESIDWALAKRP
jgi:hypothetical protein